MTLEKVGEFLNSSKAYVWQLENKDNAKPSAEIVLELSKLFQVDPYYLIDDNSKTPTDEQDEVNFISAYNALSRRNKSTVRRIVLGLQNQSH